MDKLYQVFVSSTFEDLAEERRRVSETLSKGGYIPAGMEFFPATDQQQLEFIKRVIDRCDYYVVIVGGRYGSLADDEISFTEKEYEYALEKKIPILSFLHAQPDRIEVGKTDRDPERERKLAAFRDRLSKGRIVDVWNDPQDLCTKVVIAVARAVNLSPGVGWVRGDQAVDPKTLQELVRPTLSVVYDKSNRRCKDLVTYNNGSRSVCFRLQVENDKVSNLANCEGWLTKVVQMPQISPVKIFWIGSPSEKMFEDLPEHVPRYLQIYEITETNKVIISTEGRMWPLGEENIFRPGEYSFSVVVRADGAKAVNWPTVRDDGDNVVMAAISAVLQSPVPHRAIMRSADHRRPGNVGKVVPLHQAKSIAMRSVALILVAS
jgi:hypothetical protein